MGKICLIAIDEDAVMDEDDFMLNFAFTLLNVTYAMVYRGVDTFWMKKESQFQKRIYWELMNTVFFAFPTVSINVIGEDNADDPDIIDKMTKGNVRIVEQSDFVIAYIDNKESYAYGMVEDAESKGKEILDLKKEAEENIRLEQEIRKKRILKRRKQITETSFNEFLGLDFE